MIRVVFLLPLILLSACATVLDDTTQDVRFLTPGAQQSMCEVRTTEHNKGGVLYKVYPPQTATIMKTDDKLVVHCMAEGGRDKTMIITPIVSSTGLLNVGNGLIPGLFLDDQTQALYKYPNVIEVDFAGVPYEKPPQPPYYNNPVRPDPEDLAPKRGGFPALDSSDYDPPVVPPRRQRPAAPVQDFVPPENPPIK